mmetsp:Transcript_9137/g.55530  ORF Transcript_9137/g.55530 Transcript_9137/m.55530 type:complete len:94 (-) Transcript_9137:881-1162(-)
MRLNPGGVDLLNPSTPLQIQAGQECIIVLCGQDGSIQAFDHRLITGPLSCNVPNPCVLSPIGGLHRRRPPWQSGSRDALSIRFPRSTGVPEDP